MTDTLATINNKPTILIIEDDPLLLKMYKTKLETEGFQVLTADEGESGLKLALTQKVDFVLLDIMMPKMSGIDFLTSLRQNPQGKNLPVLVFSNLIDEEKLQKAKALGVKEYLIKADLTPTQVVAKVRQYLGR